MSRTRFVKGTYTKVSEKGHSMYSNENIVTTASDFVTEKGEEKGLSIGLPQAAPKLNYTEEPDFDLELELIEKDFVPLGIPDYKGNSENDKIQFELTVTGAGINQWHLMIKNGKDILYESFSASGELDEVIITAKSIQPQTKSNEPKVSTPVVRKRFWPAGKYILSWTGFDKNGIYDSTIMKSKNGLSVSIVGQAEFKKKTLTIDKPIKFSHKEADWVDVRIDKINKKIETTLRVNLKDGGEQGLECKSQLAGARDETHWEKKCPWDEIPKSALKTNKPIIKKRTKSFADLQNLAFDGLRTYWSRSSNNGLALGKFVTIDNEQFQIDVIPQASTSNAMNSLPLIYNTNKSWMRSGNPGGSYADGNLDDNLMNAIPDTGIIQRLSYNVGYIYEYHYTKTWEYQDSNNEDEEFKETAAHELGHEILQAYSGTIYSWQHKGSSYYLPQDTKPTKGKESILEKITHWDEMDTDGENYPQSKSDEVDLMKYYNNEPRQKDKSRTVAAEKDVLGLIWLTKLSNK